MVSKNIIRCMDGTGNEFGKNVTNVVETYILANKTYKQAVYYDAGVGTGGYHYDEGTGKIRAAYHSGTGTGVHKNVEQAYKYLVETYNDGDKVDLFGFSRGALVLDLSPACCIRLGYYPLSMTANWNTRPSTTRTQRTMTSSPTTRPISADPAQYISSASGTRLIRP